MHIVFLSAAVLAAIIHVVIFYLESINWLSPKTQKIFGIKSQEAAEITKPMAFNQGFYNLFLSLGVIIGFVIYLVGYKPIGQGIVTFALASMLAAAVVLISTGPKKYLRAALVQGTAPLLSLLALAWLIIF